MSSTEAHGKDGLEFVEQVGLICELHSIQLCERGKDNCNAILAAMVAKAEKDFKAGAIPAEVADDSQQT